MLEVGFKRSGEKNATRYTLGLVVDTDGKVRSVWVVRPLGEGLDENAIDAVKKWNFMPATKDGKAVPLLMNLSIGFRLKIVLLD